MNLSDTESKKLQIASWVKMFKQCSSRVVVSDYNYHCYFTGLPVTKTLIVFPDEIEEEGIISINKPIDKVEMSDILKLCKGFKKGQ